ncbi:MULTISPECIES: c-type cytochrome [Methylobacterium]|uniref:Cytochrome c, mono-and diheme variants n=2 Tax=Methylobacterium TaxID=407 RepID=A0AAE8HWB8_9HYPH|nr:MULTISPECIES: cytochrome c [Methylobacterium]KOX48872.1 cystathionine beta-lyase [Streptomyces purpurogeneiscleroticus]APT32813.1 respiration [Methylobacterium phyllosphaerae]MBA9064826.1 mono/diheme cytochrome c family protein [Methylobacterium fujisawaense]MDE4911399.1 cytochrome c [Methylobacterium sp. 092160098-2]MDH3030892.1 cytochrome c [Methylobacterium fujisawaense]
MRTTRLLLAGVLAALPPLPAVSAPAWNLQIRQGETLARTNCARCHAIGRAGESPLRAAPPFRDLHTRYPVEDLGEALTEGIRTGHPTMPEFRFDPDQAQDLIAYLKSLER